jgi:hypothetical protein
MVMEHPVAAHLDFPEYMSALSNQLDKLRMRFEEGAHFCGHKNDASMCRHPQQLFVKPCALEACPFLRRTV